MQTFPLEATKNYTFRDPQSTLQLDSVYKANCLDQLSTTQWQNPF